MKKEKKSKGLTFKELKKQVKKIEEYSGNATYVSQRMLADIQFRQIMYYKVCKALLTGEIRSDVLEFAEMQVSIYEKEQTL